MHLRPLVLAVSVLALATSSCSSFTAFVYGGRLEYGPRELNGKQKGLWTYWYDADHTKVRARGNFEADKPIGRWEFFHENGAKRFEVGFVDEAYDGPSASWWPNASPRAQGAFARGLESGPWTFWDTNGAKVAEGAFRSGVRDGAWTWFTPNGDAETQVVFTEGRALAARRDQPADPSSNGSATIAKEESRVAPTPAPVAAPAPQPIVPPPTPEVGILPAPLTILQSGAADQDASIPSTAGFSIEELTEIYSTGNAPSSTNAGYGADDPRNSPAQPKNETELAETFRGKPLPWTRLVQGDGNVFDLSEYRGRSNVLVVVLRGLRGRVCEYCTAQMQALQSRAQEFRNLNCEIVIVYPGSGERLGQFVSAVKEFHKVHYGTEQPVSSCRISWDEDFQLVGGLGLKADLAKPAVFLLDRQGVVRFPWVSKNAQDRPNCSALLEELKKLQAR